MAAPEAAPGPVLPLVAEGIGYEVGGLPLLDGLSFRLEAGGCSVLLGPNGAGKSLTLRLCHGLLAPTRGRLEWRGPGAARARGAVAMVRQRPVLLRRSAAANVAYALRLQRVRRRERRARTERALEATGLAPLARRPARRLSGGEQQRLALARAWATRPQVLLLDEPAASLDPEAQRSLEAAVRAVSRSGTKIVMSTHDLGQARRLAQEVLFLHRGRLLEQTPAEEFFEKPRSPEARAFLGGELPW